MTIAKRLVLLLAVPLLALVGLGVFTRLQLTTIETRSRFVADMQVPSLAALGNISRIFAEMRIHVRNHVLATTEADRLIIGVDDMAHSNLVPRRPVGDLVPPSGKHGDSCPGTVLPSSATSAGRRRPGACIGIASGSRDPPP